MIRFYTYLFLMVGSFIGVAASIMLVGRLPIVPTAMVGLFCGHLFEYATRTMFDPRNPAAPRLNGDDHYWPGITFGKHRQTRAHTTLLVQAAEAQATARARH